MICTIAFPMIITGLLIYGKSLISMLFLGKIGKDALAGGSLAIGLANITGYSVISGLASGMEAISSQAFGAKQWSLMAQTLQRTIIILLFACIPISIVWVNIQPVLVLCNQNPKISKIASTYLTFCLPDLVFQSIINPLRIYLRSQNITLPLMISAALSLSLHAPINYLLVERLNLGIRGVALSVVVTDFILLANLVIYSCFCGGRRKNIYWLGGPIQEWVSILNLALPSCFSICLEWWWYEIMILLSGILSNNTEAVATMGILLQATSLVYIFPSALSLAASTRVGNELGAGQPGNARASYLIVLSCAFLTSLVAGDEAVVGLTAAVMPVVGLCELGNWPQTTGCGVLRGSARPGLGVRINLGSFYGVGLPMAVILGFVMKMGLVGLWLGLLGAQIVCAVLMVWVLSRTDWVLQASRARELIGVEFKRDGQNEGSTSIKAFC
ncbi:multidrug and toxin extrusion protein 2 [Phtheirospermum japonicum]|uniref:Multidrug and toxin extrusion protein 2 n=1 Tax=Phtheirospermum japonicum TaxID=374723 RepID=A0A830D5F6_9LAMI|nr:multidrug and toxin extrusion protein 2 [Phtheirospermum japonicum]